MSESISRRELFVQGAFYGGSLWAFVNLPRPRAARAAEQSAERLVFDEAQWKTVEAVTARIIPTDHEPGAVEANCVNFIDKTLAHEDAALKPFYLAGLAGLDAVARKRFEKPFVELKPAQQDEVLAALESGNADGWPIPQIPSAQFFEAMRAHTVIGFLADPKYGGNRGYAGWKVMGYPGGGHHLGGYSPGQLLGTEKIETAWGEEV